MPKLLFIPKAVSLSRIQGESEDEEPIEFGRNDPNIDNPLQGEAFLFVIKALPKDRYRVIALLLYMSTEMGFDYTYQDIAQIWGCSKVNIHNHVVRMRKTLDKAGIGKTL